jgi:hypothetical protein
VFLPVALRYGTRTLFSFQGALLSITKHIQICNIEISNKVGSYEEKSNESLFTGLMAKATDKPIYPHGLKSSGLRRVPVFVIARTVRRLGALESTFGRKGQDAIQVWQGQVTRVRCVPWNSGWHQITGELHVSPDSRGGLTGWQRVTFTFRLH